MLHENRVKVINLHCLSSSNVRICILFDDPTSCLGEAVRIRPFNVFISSHPEKKRDDGKPYKPTKKDVDTLLAMPTQPLERAGDAHNNITTSGRRGRRLARGVASRRYFY